MIYYLYILCSGTPRLCPVCNMNPGKLLCSCKGFRHIGICSHSIAVNHWTREVDLDTIMKSLDGDSTRKRKQSGAGGYTKGVRPALIKEGPGKKPTQKKKKNKKKKLTHREA